MKHHVHILTQFNLILGLLCLLTFGSVIEFPVASMVRYHLPDKLAKQVGCYSHSQGPRCCPSADDLAATRGALVPFVAEDETEAFGVQRCLRATGCHANAPNMQASGRVQPWQKSRIAILSMRETSISAYAQHTEALLASFASKWGYHYIVVELDDNVPCRRSISWERVELVRRHLPNHEYVLFLDADIAVMEHNAPWLESIIEAHPTADVIVCKDSGFIAPDVKQGIGGAHFANFGAFILRNSSWTMGMIEEWWEMGEGIYKWQDPYEQAAFGDMYAMKQSNEDTNWLSHVAILETTELNSLDPFYVHHKKGMPVLHTTMRLPRMRQTLFATIHHGLCMNHPDLLVNATWVTQLVLRDAKQSVEEQRSNAEMHMIYSAVLHHVGDDTEALQHIQAANTLRPNDIFYIESLGNAYERIGKQDKALAQYDKALALGPQLERTVRKKGSLMIRMGMVEEAMASVQTYLSASDPAVNHFSLLFEIGTSLLQTKKNIHVAEKLLRKAIGLDASSERAALNLGIALQYNEKWKESLQYLQMVCESSDSDLRERALISAARSFLLSGEPSHAVNILLEFRQSFPSSALVKLAENLMRAADQTLKH